MDPKLELLDLYSAVELSKLDLTQVYFELGSLYCKELNIVYELRVWPIIVENQKEIILSKVHHEDIHEDFKLICEERYGNVIRDAFHFVDIKAQFKNGRHANHKTNSWRFINNGLQNYRTTIDNENIYFSGTAEHNSHRQVYQEWFINAKINLNSLEIEIIASKFSRFDYK